jgi:hypothetical protein
MMYDNIPDDKCIYFLFVMDDNPKAVPENVMQRFTCRSIELYCWRALIKSLARRWHVFSQAASMSTLN